MGRRTWNIHAGIEGEQERTDRCPMSLPFIHTFIHSGATTPLAREIVSCLPPMCQWPVLQEQETDAPSPGSHITKDTDRATAQATSLFFPPPALSFPGTGSLSELSGLQAGSCCLHTNSLRVRGCLSHSSRLSGAVWDLAWGDPWPWLCSGSIPKAFCS